MRKPLIAVACIALIAIAVMGAVILVKTAPEAERKRPPKQAIPVETVTLEKSDHTVVLHLAGTVVPASEVVLRARISGEVIETHPDFIEGGILSEGETVLQIDPIDYELALADAESNLQQAQALYKLELGRQDVAQREWELLKTADASEQEMELALRAPQLAASEAALKAAEAALERAQLNLERTRITAPGNSIVLERNAETGSQVLAMQDRLAVLAGTDAYWVQVSIPIDRIDWVEIPGSKVELVSNSGATRTGKVIKLLSDLEERGRMARLLVEVEDPLCLQPEHNGLKPLLLEEYVRAEISGRVVENAFRIPRNALHENNRVWIAKDGKLDFRPVEVVWRDDQHVIIRNGMDDGELLIVSDIASPISGMDVNPGTVDTEQKEG